MGAAAPSAGWALMAAMGKRVFGASVVAFATAVAVFATQGGDPVVVVPTPTATPTATATPTPTPDPNVANLFIDSNGGTCKRQAPRGSYVDAEACTLTAAVSAVQNGDLVLVRTATLGAFAGTSKSFTLKGYPGDTKPSMTISFNNGDTGAVVMDGFRAMSGDATGNASNFTIKNSDFSFPLVLSVSNANILLDSNTHNNINRNASCTDTPARLHFPVSGNTGVTVRNSEFRGGNADGIQTGGAVTIEDNEFVAVWEKSDSDCQHTDPIQLFEGRGSVIRRNYIHDSVDGIVAYDSTGNLLIEDNVIDLRKVTATVVNPRHAIELYADTDSIVRHNTLVYGTDCQVSGAGTCGALILSRKLANSPGTGTVVSDNVMTRVETGNGSTYATFERNLMRTGSGGTGGITGSPTFMNGTAGSAKTGYALAPGSLGKGAGAGGVDIGARLGS